jgi:hypothetical protein
LSAPEAIVTLAGMSYSQQTASISRLIAGYATLVAIAVLALATSANAATFTVNDPTDAPLANPAGSACASTHGGSCTLRAAVAAAYNAGGASTITLPAATITLSTPATPPALGGAVDPANGDLDVVTGVSLTINGAGAGATIIDAGRIDRAFAVHKGAALTISGVTIRHGAQPETAPSRYSIDPGAGGAIYNDGALSIDASVLSDNSADDEGGAVYSDDDASSTTISNSTLTRNASDDEGGAINVFAGTLTLAGDTITHNSSDDDGGAINVDAPGPISITGTTISHNVADDDGGALYVEDSGALTVTDSTVDDNSTDDDVGGAIVDEDSGRLTIAGSSFDGDNAGAEEGGAVYTDETDLSVDHSSFTHDGAGEGGAIWIEGTSNTASESITNSRFADDIATEDSGGAVFDDFGALTIAGSVFFDDNASDEGGAFTYNSQDALSLVNDTFDGNQALEGGSIYFEQVALTGSISLLNDTITRSTAYDGGGIAQSNDINRIQNTIVAGNSGGPSPGVGADCDVPVDMAADKGNNIDSDGSCFGGLGAGGDQVGVDPLLAGLATNGGPTETDALLPGSPAIGRADGSACPSTDQRGVSRAGLACDVGAFQTTPPAVTSTPPATTAASPPPPSAAPVTAPVTAPATDVKPATAAKKAKPRGLTFHVKASADHSRPFAYAFSGTLQRPSGVSAAAGCKGTVTVTIAHGTTTVARATAAVSKKCTYDRTVTVSSKAHLHGHGVLRAMASYGGNTVLATARATSLTLRFA